MAQIVGCVMRHIGNIPCTGIGRFIMSNHKSDAEVRNILKICVTACININRSLCFVIKYRYLYTLGRTGVIVCIFCAACTLHVKKVIGCGSICRERTAASHPVNRRVVINTAVCLICTEQCSSITRCCKRGIHVC